MSSDSRNDKPDWDSSVMGISCEGYEAMTSEDQARFIYKSGCQLGRIHGLVEGLRLHLSAKFGPAGRRLANSARFLDASDSIREFMQLCWPMRSFKKVRACFGEIAQREKSAVRSAT